MLSVQVSPVYAGVPETKSFEFECVGVGIIIWYSQDNSSKVQLTKELKIEFMNYA